MSDDGTEDDEKEGEKAKVDILHKKILSATKLENENSL